MKLHRGGLLLIAAVAGSAGSLRGQAADPSAAANGDPWVTPPAELPEGVMHRTLHSSSMNREVGYSIYLPPGYDGGNRLYPVVYWLHGRGGTEADVAAARVLDGAVDNGLVQPMVLVLANGGASSGFIDNPANGVMGETVILEELIPHIEETYRVSSDASGRGITGFEMGGGGAVRMAVRHPELFRSVVSLGGDLVSASELVERGYVGNPVVAALYDPYPLSIDAAPKLRKVNLELLVGSEDPWLPENRRFAAHLGHQNLTIEYRELRGVGSALQEYLDSVGLEVFQFHSVHLTAGS